jgi:hypothetical protein
VILALVELLDSLAPLDRLVPRVSREIRDHKDQLEMLVHKDKWVIKVCRVQLELREPVVALDSLE